jgi:hypothetical protein
MKKIREQEREVERSINRLDAAIDAAIDEWGLQETLRAISMRIHNKDLARKLWKLADKVTE